MILITSGAYVRAALVAEFGLLPPAFLPVQSQRLFAHQLRLFPEGEKIFLSCPKSFEPSVYDLEALKDKAEIIKVPDRLTLGQSIIYCLNMASRYGEPLYILHGDTLFDAVEMKPDVYAVAHPQDDYAWAGTDDADDTIYAGFFSFSSQEQFIKSLTENNYDFIKGIEDYRRHIPVEEIMFPSWKDFGLINSFYRSVSDMTTERAFNSLKATKYSITKYSRDSKKILAEAHWFEALPKSLRHFAPTVWDSGIDGDRGFYQIPYYYLSSLANLWVFGRNSFQTWKSILASCVDFVNQTASHKPADLARTVTSNNILFGEKTRSRLVKYCVDAGVDMDRPWSVNGIAVPSLNAILSDLDDSITLNAERFAAVMHGDFCFSNILYDFKSKSIRVIDPRGCDPEGNESIYGDIRYDVAKLAHSVLGMYDYIIGGHYSLDKVGENGFNLTFPETDEILAVQQHFEQTLFAGYDITELETYPIMISLFLSMLPLHSDRPDRQQAMLANALRLYAKFKTR